MKNAIVALSFSILFSISASAQIQFMHQPKWKDVLAQAQKENKAIFVDAYTDWCVWCKTMDKNTFSDARVIEYINKNFVCVKMEMETGFGATLAMKYRVFGFPTFLVFSPDGKFIERTLGYQKPEDFMETVGEILTTSETDFPKGISEKIEVPFPDFYKKVFIEGKKNTKSYPDTTTVRSFLQQQKDLTGEIAWSVLYRFYSLAGDYDDWIIEHSTQLQRLYGKQELEGAFSRIINKRFQQVIKLDDEDALQKEVFALVDKYLPIDAEQTKANYKISFYTATAKYGKALLALNELSSIPGSDYSATANSACWEIYEKCDEEAILQMASTLMSQVIASQPEYAYLDTYAALLYKTKDYARAEEFALKAIEEGKKENQKVDETEQLLKKIREAVQNN